MGAHSTLETFRDNLGTLACESFLGAGLRVGNVIVSSSVVEM